MILFGFLQQAVYLWDKKRISIQMTDKDIISGIESGVTNIRQYIQPILSGVRDVTFDDVYQEACIILMENIKAGKLDTGSEVNLSRYL